MVQLPAIAQTTTETLETWINGFTSCPAANLYVNTDFSSGLGFLATFYQIRWQSIRQGKPLSDISAVFMSTYAGNNNLPKDSLNDVGRHTNIPNPALVRIAVSESKLMEGTNLNPNMSPFIAYPIDTPYIDVLIPENFFNADNARASFYQVLTTIHHAISRLKQTEDLLKTKNKPLSLYAWEERTAKNEFLAQQKFVELFNQCKSEWNIDFAQIPEDKNPASLLIRKIKEGQQKLLRSSWEQLYASEYCKKHPKDLYSCPSKENKFSQSPINERGLSFEDWYGLFAQNKIKYSQRFRDEIATALKIK